MKLGNVETLSLVARDCEDRYLMPSLMAAVVVMSGLKRLEVTMVWCCGCHEDEQHDAPMIEKVNFLLERLRKG